MHIRSLLLVAAVLFTVPAVAQVATGKWNATVPSSQGPLPLVFAFAVEAGSKLTGSVSSDPIGQAAIQDGKITGNRLSFAVAWQAPDGTPLRIDYAGVLNGDELELTGRLVSAGPDGPPAFTVVAKRQR